MPATKRSVKSPARKVATSRATKEKVAGKKKVVKKRSSPGMFSRAAHAMGDILVGTAAGAMAGAIEGAVEAGGKAMGIPKASDQKESPPKDTAEKPGGKKPKNRK